MTLISQFRGNDNQILFFLEWLFWLKRKGIFYASTIEQAREEVAQHWAECYLPATDGKDYFLILRAKGHPLRQSHDNILAWFVIFKLLKMHDHLKLIYELMDSSGWHLRDYNGDMRVEGMMPPVLVNICRLMAGKELPAFDAFYTAAHSVYARAVKTVWNLEFIRTSALQLVSPTGNASIMAKAIYTLAFTGVDWGKHAQGYHGKGSVIHELIDKKYLV